jgi:ATP-dependent 26S proteasome regulatory subunit
MKRNILILATTNKIDSIDSALRCHGKFGREIEIPIPNKNDRKEVFFVKIKLIN